MIRADVLIVGAGPTGATVALNLAPTRRVILLERKAQAVRRIGEALPSAAQRLLSDMGLFDTFVAEGHAPCYGNRAVWGSAASVDSDFLREPDGHGWHLDRARFDSWLRRTAIARGASVLTSAQLVAIQPTREGWRAQLATARGRVDVSAAFAIDAGGRAAPLARRLGAQRRATDRLVCGWIHGSALSIGRGAGLTAVEAVEDGWFYTAPVPEGRRVLAFLTDADLPAAAIARNRSRFAECVTATREIRAILAESKFVPIDSGLTAAHSSALEPCAAERWIAAGDASLSFDPLSAQGLLHALFTGLAAAEAADAYLSGDGEAVSRYRQMVDGIRRAYYEHLELCYASETRWPRSPFWKRRQTGTGDGPVDR